MAVQESKETAGSPAFVGAALLFAAATLFYSIKDSLQVPAPFGARCSGCCGAR
jgi:hypothetical protein